MFSTSAAIVTICAAASSGALRKCTDLDLQFAVLLPQCADLDLQVAIDLLKHQRQVPNLHQEIAQKARGQTILRRKLLCSLPRLVAQLIKITFWLVPSAVRFQEPHYLVKPLPKLMRGRSSCGRLGLGMLSGCGRLMLGLRSVFGTAAAAPSADLLCGR